MSLTRWNANQRTVRHEKRSRKDLTAEPRSCSLDRESLMNQDVGNSSLSVSRATEALTSAHAGRGRGLSG